MEPSPVSPYLREAVLTASPLQLQLMLFDGAIRFAAQARDRMQAGDIEQAHHLLTRAQQIVCEMSRGLRHDVEPQLCSRMAALYVFVFNRLVDANVRHDPAALGEALNILERQRETWCLLMEKLQAGGAGGQDLCAPPLSG